MRFDAAPPEDEPITDDDELAGALTEAREAEADLAAAEGRRAKAREALVALLDARGEKTLTAYDHNGRLWRTTVVRGESSVVDLEGLRKAIGGHRFNRLTVRKLDTKKIEAAIADGTLPVEVYAAHTTLKPKAIFPLVTEVQR